MESFLYVFAGSFNHPNFVQKYNIPFQTWEVVTICGKPKPTFYSVHFNQNTIFLFHKNFQSILLDSKHNVKYGDEFQGGHQIVQPLKYKQHVYVFEGFGIGWLFSINEMTWKRITF